MPPPYMEPTAFNEPNAVATRWTPRPPVRGTQSFVNTMSAVWRRPSLTALEVLWRWSAGVPLLALVAWEVRRLWPLANVDTSAVLAMTVFRPLDAFATIQDTLGALYPVFFPTARWLVPLLLALWTLAWSLGRTFVLRRLEPELRQRFVSLFLLRALRSGLLLLLLILWWWGAEWAARSTISGPGSQGHEPNLVLFCALIICGSLALFVGWAAVNWVADVAPLLTMRVAGRSAPEALRTTFLLGAARGKLVETNLVMGIVKIALLVLALVFSACPLPFEDVATQGFLINWWAGVAVFYFIASDYFHVVRSAAYLALLPHDAQPVLVDPLRESK